MPNYSELLRGLASDVALKHNLSPDQRKMLIAETLKDAVTTRGGVETKLRSLQERNPLFGEKTPSPPLEALRGEFGGMTASAFHALPPEQRLDWANRNVPPRKRS